MGGALQLVGDWGHIVGAALFAVLAIWISRRLAAQRHGKLLVAALMLTSVWLLSIAFNGVDRMETGIMESLRNCGWLVYLFVLPAQSGQKVARQARGAIPLYGVLALLLVAQSALDILAGMTASTSGTAAAIHDSAIALRMLWAIGALILVQRIYSACPASLRAMIAPVAASMAAMWSYDLVLYGSAFLRDGMVAPLYALRGGLMAALAPAIALVVRTSRKAVVAPSRHWYDSHARAPRSSTSRTRTAASRTVGMVSIASRSAPAARRASMRGPWTSRRTTSPGS